MDIHHLNNVFRYINLWNVHVNYPQVCVKYCVRLITSHSSFIGYSVNTKPKLSGLIIILLLSSSMWYNLELMARVGSVV